MSEGARKERKLVTVLFADLVGFTARAETLDPEDVEAVLAPYHRHLRGELERFGGTVEKFIGDAVVAVFGAPTAHEDDPERAVRSALAIRDWAKEQPGLELRIAVNTGEALVSLGARPEHGEGMVAGDVVNTASRLQSAAPTNGILVGKTTFRATRDTIDYRAAAPVEAKGKAEPIAVWEALDARSRLGVDTVHATAAPLVGRERELGLLADALGRARAERMLQLVTLVGVPGIGKSRLVYELMQLADADPDLIRWRQGRCLPYGEGVTYWALGEVVKSHCGIFESDPAEDAERKLARALAELLPDERDRRWVERHLRLLVGLSAEAAAAGDAQSEIFAAWRTFFEALAEETPLVLVVEDLHWADEKLLDFVDELVETASDVPILVVCTARPEVLERRPGWGGGKANALTLSLSPLADDETARLLAAQLDRPLLAADQQRAVLDRASGNPLFVEQYARMLEERGAVDEHALPPTIQAVIAARLDTLPPAEKSLLHDAAVHGKVFWSGAVAAMAVATGNGVGERLRSLEQKQFVRRQRRSSVAGETEYAFRHVLVRDVAYGQIPRGERAGKHREAAEWLDALSERDDHVEVLADHYVNALELARAAGRATDELEERARHALRDAGDRAFALNAFATAARQYARALELLARDDPGRPYVLLAYGRALGSSEYAGDEALAEARDRLAELGDRESAAEAELALADLAFNRDGDLQRALDRVARAAALIEGEPPSPTQARTLAERARFHLLGLELDAAIAAGREAVATAERLGLEDVRAHALNTIGTGRAQLTDPGGIEDLERSLEIARRIDSARDLLRGYNNLSAALERVGDWTRSGEVLEEGILEAERLGQRALASALRGNRPIAYWASGDWDEAVRLAEEFVTEAASFGAEASSRGILARVRFARGDTLGAVDEQRRTVERYRTLGDPGLLGAALFDLAHMLRTAGRAGEAEPLVEEALAIAHGSPFGATTVEAVSILREFGRGDELRQILASAPAGGLYAPAREHVGGNFDRAAALYAEMGIRPSEAYTHLCAARAGVPDAHRHAEAAAVFYRSVAATRYVEEAERLLARVA